MNDAPELADLPWEYLYDPTARRHLALSDATPVVRYLEMPQSEQPLMVTRPLRILALISDPSGVPKLDVEREWALLQQSLATLQQGGMVQLTRLERATLSDLQSHLRQQETHILHFIGHGAFSETDEQGALYLEDENGHVHEVAADVLGTLLHDHRPLRLAFLNACEGARGGQRDPFNGVAQHLVQQGVPAVIAMQFPVSDGAAISLSQEFYRSLADGYGVDAAVVEARKAIFAKGNASEWATPVLFTRAPDGQLFDIEGAGEECPEPGEPPFKGLEFFDTDDADLFFGREALTAELAARLRTPRFLAIIGASGSGKSSLARAGLIPALRRGQPLADGVLPPENSSHWRYHIFTPGAHPLKSLAASLTQESESVTATTTLMEDMARNTQSLDLFANRLLAQSSSQGNGAPRLLLFVDQFEEIFTHDPRPRRARGLCRQPTQCSQRRWQDHCCDHAARRFLRQLRPV
ncbi:MAG: CHAT domain-containing protein [Caldilineaceae bacterium]|nr:CHAT domain-containing protein [Caldilineaceae bacterium]